MMLVVDGQLQVDIFWVAVQQLLGKDPKEAPLRQPPENFSWGQISAKYYKKSLQNIFPSISKIILTESLLYL